MSFPGSGHWYKYLWRLANEHTHIAGLEVGFLGTDQERCISNGGVSVLHLLVLLFVFVLREKSIFATHQDFFSEKSYIILVVLITELTEHIYSYKISLNKNTNIIKIFSFKFLSWWGVMRVREPADKQQETYAKLKKNWGRGRLTSL